MVTIKRNGYLEANFLLWNNLKREGVLTEISCLIGCDNLNLHFIDILRRGNSRLK